MFYYDENGEETMSNLIQPCGRWILGKEAAGILCVATGSFNSEFRPGNEYFGLRRKLRGHAGATSARGQGQLWFKQDVERVMEIKRTCGISMKSAARVFQAEAQNKIILHIR